MNRKYTHDEINQFFTRFKELPDSYDFEKVHPLINNPNARARHLVNLNPKPLKIIIMTSAFITGTAALLLWLEPGKTIEVTNQQVQETQERNHISLSEVKKERISPAEVKNKATKENEMIIKVEQFPGLLAPAEIFTNISQSRGSDDSVVNGPNFINYAARNITEGMHLIELSKPELQKLGFIFSDSSISYDNRLFEIKLFKKGQSIVMHQENSVTEFMASYILLKDTSTTKAGQHMPINLVYLSDEFGEQNVQWITDFDDEDKNTPEYFLNKSQVLIPILLLKSNYPEQMSQNQVFWFEPSSALFDSLPEYIGPQLSREYNYIAADKNEKLNLPASNCIYFEACKSTLEIDDFRLYPNPAQLNATIDFTLTESISGWISLVSISGSQLKILVPSTSFSEGKNSFIVDISDILSGIYLVLLSTDKGFQTQRLIISR